MNITRSTKNDYDQIVSELSDFWGHDHNRSLHHPMFVNEFRDSAYVIRDHEKVVAYLLGFVAQAEPIGYIHLVAVRRSHRQLGLARQLYDHFAAFAVSRGCSALKAITTPENAGSIRFHQAYGFHLEGTPNPEGVPVITDYAGPGVERVVFRKSLEDLAVQRADGGGQQGPAGVIWAVEVQPSRHGEPLRVQRFVVEGYGRESVEDLNPAASRPPKARQPGRCPIGCRHSRAILHGVGVWPLACVS